MFFKWLRNQLGGKSVKSTKQDGVLDLDEPQRVISQSAFVRGAGGGKCSKCLNFANVIHDDGKCSRCTTSGVIVPSDNPKDKKDTCRRR